MERPAATLALTITLAIYLAACHSTPPGEHVAVAAPAAVAPAQAAPAHAAAAPITAVTLPTAAAGEPAAADPAVQKAISAQAGDKLDRDLRRLGYKPETRGGEIYYCRTETELGSRFDHRVCAPAKELERRMNDSKDFTNRIQSGGIGPVK